MSTPSFTCPACGLTTHNPNDFVTQHCVRCHKFMREWGMLLCLTMSAADVSRVADQGYLYGRTTVCGRFLAAELRPGGAALLLWNRDEKLPADVWEYDTVSAAIVAAATWDPALSPEPFGWRWHARSQRRRPHGNPAKEFLQAMEGDCKR